MNKRFNFLENKLNVEQFCSNLVELQFLYIIRSCATFLKIYLQTFLWIKTWAFISIFNRIRCLGSAALSLCYVAMGALEAYHVESIEIWDIAAGYLIIKEAGGDIVDTSGKQYYFLWALNNSSNGNSHFRKRTGPRDTQHYCLLQFRHFGSTCTPLSRYEQLFFSLAMN